jgi:phosphoenolpyruvate carboxykinase (ATP)
MLEHMKGRDFFVQDLYAGADPAHRLDVRVVTELAWHGLFIRHLLRRPTARSSTLRARLHDHQLPSFKRRPRATAAGPRR